MKILSWLVLFPVSALAAGDPACESLDGLKAELRQQRKVHENTAPRQMLLIKTVTVRQDKLLESGKKGLEAICRRAGALHAPLPKKGNACEAQKALFERNKREHREIVEKILPRIAALRSEFAEELKGIQRANRTNIFLRPQGALYDRAGLERELASVYPDTDSPTAKTAFGKMMVQMQRAADYRLARAQELEGEAMVAKRQFEGACQQWRLEWWRPLEDTRGFKQPLWDTAPAAAPAGGGSAE